MENKWCAGVESKSFHFVTHHIYFIILLVSCTIFVQVMCYRFSVAGAELN